MSTQHHEDTLAITPEVLRNMGCEEIVPSKEFRLKTPEAHFLIRFHDEGKRCTFCTVDEYERSGDGRVGNAVTHVSELIGFASMKGYEAGQEDLKAKFRRLMDPRR